MAIQDDSFFETAIAKANLESAGAVGDYNWHLKLPTSARVSPLTQRWLRPDTLRFVHVEKVDG